MELPIWQLLSLWQSSGLLCYVLVDNGVDVGALLAKIGIEFVASEKTGMFAIAYAAHKGASLIHFPPSVVFTLIVAKLNRSIQKFELSDRQAKIIILPEINNF